MENIDVFRVDRATCIVEETKKKKQKKTASILDHLLMSYGAMDKRHTRTDANIGVELITPLRFASGVKKKKQNGRFR